MTTEDFQLISPSLPKEPGIYRFIDKTDTILYVGKAKNLKNRLSSYFGNKKHQRNKTKVLVRNAVRIDYTLVETEHDALLLESTLIKKFQPRYNVMLKDGKSYTYICIKKERFPRVFFTRNIYKDGSVYFGPYTSKYRVSQILEIIKKLFPLRNCSYNLSESNIAKGKFKVCLEYHIKNCNGPCEGHETEENYNAKIDQIKNILRGNFKLVKEHIREQMAWFSERLMFEKAQEYKEKYSIFTDYQAKSTVVSSTIHDVDVFTIAEDEEYAYVNYLKVINGVLINTDTIELKKNLNDNPDDLLRFAIDMLREKFNSVAPEIVLESSVSLLDKELGITIPQRGDKKKLLDLSLKNVKYYILQKRKLKFTLAQKETNVERILKTLQSDLQMEELPAHIECFDNSNIQGTDPTASCVVFKNAKPSKKDYRHFKIKTVEGPNDFASMEEVVFRRYKRLIDTVKPLPQLIVIDGGKGQLSSAMKSIRALGIEDRVTVIGIAKKLEEIFFANDSIPLYINKKSESLKLIQQTRNEAHRFALTLHRNIRSKNFIKTQLTEIAGIGEKTAEKLLVEFGSVEKIKGADGKLIEKIIGPYLTQKIMTELKGKE